MLVSAKEMLEKARDGKYAVGQFNINNLEWTKSILLTVQELNSPVILGVSEGAGKYMCGYKTVVGMVNGMLEELNITVPVALHLDHGHPGQGRKVDVVLDDQRADSLGGAVSGKRVAVPLGAHDAHEQKPRGSLAAVEKQSFSNSLSIETTLSIESAAACARLSGTLASGLYSP